jgi:hypothetical protein
VGNVADHLDSLTVRVTSPDNRIMARLANRTQVTFEFRPGAYDEFDERTLEYQLGKLCRLMWVGYTRGYSRAMEKLGLNFRMNPKYAKTPQERRFLTERTQVVAIGATEKRLVRIKTVGLIEWEFRITDGTIKKVAEPEFLLDLHTAGRTLMRDFNKRMVFLKDDCYDMGLARQLRSKGIEPPT